MNGSIELKVNGNPTTLNTDPSRVLLWVLRTELNLTGTKFGCGIGLCGACTVLVDGQAQRACQVTLREVIGAEVTTIEGLATAGQLHPLQKAFVEHSAMQCGFCTPGMILNAYSLLKAKPSPTEPEVIEAMNNHLCRCGAHPRILAAILDAAAAMKGVTP